jgi:hypothetical protein
MSRWIRFLTAILIGIGLGLAYGWLVNPVEYVDTSPDSLGVDYKTDYVLMVAEAYKLEGDLPLAIRRLALLGATAPVDLVYQAISFAQKAGYIDADLEVMQALLNDLQAFGPGQGSPP